MDKGKGKGKVRVRKPIIAPATSTTTSEDMDVQEEAPARGASGPLHHPRRETRQPRRVAWPGSATKKRRTSLARNTTSQMNQNTHRESLAEADGNDESKEPSPQKT